MFEMHVGAVLFAVEESVQTHLARRRLEKIEIIPEIYRYDCSKYGTISVAEVSS